MDNDQRRSPELVAGRAAGILEEMPPPLPAEVARQAVSFCLEDRARYLDIAGRHGSPLYMVDTAGLVRDLRAFERAFSALPGRTAVFYAMKSNNCPLVVETLAQAGAGIDVSSGLELEAAMSAGAGRILFSGPGKTSSELEAAVENGDRVTLLVDSFGELARLDSLTRRMRREIRAGVRLNSSQRPLWRKFGIPLASLEHFMRLAAPMPFVRLEGLQFHSSWNLGPEPQAAFIEELSGTLRGLPAPLLRGISFIDIGGGYWPPQGEWLRPGGTPAGRLRNILSGEEPGPRERYILASAPLEEFAASISRALEASLPGEVDCDIYLEPGRWLCHGNMHLLMSVVDVKAPDIVITDAGTNAVGWERFEHDWFPVVNLSRPSPEEHDMLVLGSLCTPHDVWGWSYHGDGIKPGDLLMIPFQGAYTFSLRQEFIKPLPSTVAL